MNIVNEGNGRVKTIYSQIESESISVILYYSKVQVNLSYFLFIKETGKGGYKSIPEVNHIFRHMFCACHRV